MFWNDIEEIKEWMDTFSARMTDLNMSIHQVIEDQKVMMDIRDPFHKFEDYMKNVDKLNSMINEFKGCVAIARGSLSFSRSEKKLEDDTRFQIHAIYNAICEKNEEKSTTLKKRVKKKAASRVPES